MLLYLIGGNLLPEPAFTTMTHDSIGKDIAHLYSPHVIPLARQSYRDTTEIISPGPER